MGPKDREERQLMRQRGAGTRQVKNIGFDLVLPGQENVPAEPLRPFKSGRSRKTPQPELPPQRSSRWTPKSEKTQLQQSSRKTPATRITKKRGRPVKEAVSDEIEDLSTSRVTQADEGGVTTKKRKTTKAQEGQENATVSTVPEVQGDALETTEAAKPAAPSVGVKKRKKRKSIGQQSMSRAKAAKTQSPRKLASQPRKRVPKPGLADAREATDAEAAFAKEVLTETHDDALAFDGGEPALLPEAAEVVVSGVDMVEPSAEKPKKRKRMPVQELPKKRIKASSSQSRRAPKAPPPQKKIVPAEDALDAVQSIEKPDDVEAGSMGAENAEQEVITAVAEPQKETPKQTKRVTVGQQPKKRAKGGVTRDHRKPEAQRQISTAEDALKAAESVEGPPEIEAGSMVLIAEEQEAPAEEVKPQTHKPKRKKRKLIGQQRPKKKSVDLATANRTATKTEASSLMARTEELDNKPAAKRGRPRTKQPLEEAIEEPQVESLAHVPEEEKEIPLPKPGLDKLKARRGRPKATPVSKDTIDELDEEGEEEGAQAQVLPQKKKRGRPRKADAAQPTSQTSRPTKPPSSRKPKTKAIATAAPRPHAPPKNSIPITIYAPPSPASSDADADPLSTSPPHPTTNTVNPVDVLSQLCSGLLSKSSSALALQAVASSSSSTTNRSESKRAQETTDSYAAELTSRLLQLTTALDANASLHSRVKAAAKEEKGLKKELKRLEMEGKELRGRKEEVLRERKKKELEHLLTGISGAVKKGWEMQKKEGEGGDDAVAGTVEDGDVDGLRGRDE